MHVSKIVQKLVQTEYQVSNNLSKINWYALLFDEPTIKHPKQCGCLFGLPFLFIRISI